MADMGQRINQKRLEMGLTMEELGKMVGVGASAVNKWEKGNVENLKRSTIQKLADIFNCSPVWLMGYVDKDLTEEERLRNQIMFEMLDPDIDELGLIDNFRGLNEEGQRRVKEYMTDIMSMDKYLIQ